MEVASALAIGADALVTHDRDFALVRGLRILASAIAPAKAGRIYNADLLRTVWGLKAELVEANAVAVLLSGSRTRSAASAINLSKR